MREFGSIMRSVASALSSTTRKLPGGALAMRELLQEAGSVQARNEWRMATSVPSLHARACTERVGVENPGGLESQPY
jgi:hypothetical protein